MRLLFLLLLLACIFSCSQKEKPSAVYGKLKNADKIYVSIQKISEQGEETLDSVLTDKDGNFEMKNPATTPEFYVLRTNKTNLVFLLLKAGDRVEVSGDASKLEDTYKVHGSKDSELILRLRNFDRHLSDSLNQVYETKRVLEPENKDSIGMSLQQYYSFHMDSFAKKFIQDNMNSLVSLSATKFLNQQEELSLMSDLRDSLLKHYPDNKYVNDYDALIAALKKLPPGSECPDITLQTPDGKLLSLTSFRGKVVLIDFWASWCGPCRRDNPQIVDIYNRYRGKHFEIFGVSLDENIDAWKNAIVKDKITWPQVSELRRWDSHVVQEFNVEAIPYNILIDREGNIIAKGLRIEDLENKIAEAIASGTNS